MNMNMELEPQYRHLGYPGILFDLDTQAKSSRKLASTIRLLTDINSKIGDILGEDTLMEAYIPTSDCGNGVEGSDGVTGQKVGKVYLLYHSLFTYNHYHLRNTWSDAAETLRDAIYVNHRLSAKLMKEKNISIIDEMLNFSRESANGCVSLPDELFSLLYRHYLHRMRRATIRMISTVEELIPIQNEVVAELRQ